MRIRGTHDENKENKNKTPPRNLAYLGERSGHGGGERIKEELKSGPF